MTRPKARMWAVKDPSGHFIGPVHADRRCALALVGIHGDYRFHSKRGYRCVRVSVTELHPRKKARRG